MTNEKLKIGILETGRPPEELAAKHGDYPEMVRRWLKPFNAEFETYAALDGQLPASPDEADVWVITGSRFGVYEDHPWIAPLEDFIRQCRDAGKKMIGICFGHQLIAQALGGRVEKSDKGWGLGVHEYQPVNWPEDLSPGPEKLRIQAFHQDQVVEPPKDAKRIAQSEFCDYAALWYPGFAITVQGHPEFDRDYTRDLLTSRRGTVLPELVTDQGLATLPQDTTRDSLAHFLREHLKDI